MENITIGQVATGIALLVGLIVGGKELYKDFKKTIENILSAQIKPLSDSIAELSDQLNKVDMESCKNFLVRCLSDIERGEGMCESEVQRFKEQYDHYLKNGGNTYIKDKVDKLKAEDKL